MVQAIVNISDHANRIISIIKVRDGLRTKSEAIEKMTKEYENKILAPQLRPEFAAEVLKSERGNGTRYRSAKEAMKDILD